MIALLIFAATVDLTVSETAGIRRFGYPVAARLTFKDDLTGKERFRLLDGKKALLAQFRPDGKRAVWLDFNLSPGPNEKKALTVEYGPDVEAGPEPKGEVSVTEERGAFVARSGGMSYTVPADLEGLLSGVKGGKLEYLKPGSKGLWVETKKGRTAVKGLKGTVTRQGPLAAALRFVGKVEGVDVTVDLLLPRSKSWIEVSVTAGVKASGADLKLELGSPALVDFGAGGGTYVALKEGQTAAIQADSPMDRSMGRWVMSVGGERFVVGEYGSIAHGWAHAMDRTRCTAFAVEGFEHPSRGGKNEIAIAADGRLSLAKQGTPPHFWLHFVTAPVHVGAVTSPQSMMTPLEVDVKTP